MNSSSKGGPASSIDCGEAAGWQTPRCPPPSWRESWPQGLARSPRAAGCGNPSESDAAPTRSDRGKRRARSGRGPEGENPGGRLLRSAATRASTPRSPSRSHTDHRRGRPTPRPRTISAMRSPRSKVTKARARLASRCLLGPAPTTSCRERRSRALRLYAAGFRPFLARISSRPSSVRR